MSIHEITEEEDRKIAVEQFEIWTKFLVEQFAKKHGLEFDGFVRDDPTGVAEFGDYIFNIGEIYYDLKTEQPKGRILDYQDFCVEIHHYNDDITDKSAITIPNYESYCMGIAETEYYKGFGK